MHPSLQATGTGQNPAPTCRAITKKRQMHAHTFYHAANDTWYTLTCTRYYLYCLAPMSPPSTASYPPPPAYPQRTEKRVSQPCDDQPQQQRLGFQNGARPHKKNDLRLNLKWVVLKIICRVPKKGHKPPPDVVAKNKSQTHVFRICVAQKRTPVPSARRKKQVLINREARPTSN